jgi:hypothetical protein
MNADCAGGDATPCIPVRPTDRPTADSTGQAPTPASRWVREGFAQSSLPPSLWQRQLGQRIGGTSLLLCLRLSPRPCPPPCPLECFALDVGQRSGISRGRGEAGTSKADPPARDVAGAGCTARGLLGLMPVSLATARICCKFWNCPGFVRRAVGAGAGGLDWITAPSRALRRAWLPLPTPAPNRPVLPPCWAFLLALGCWRCCTRRAGLVLGCWAAGRTGLALLALACWPCWAGHSCWCCFAGAGCTVGHQGRRGTPQSLRGERG